MQERQQVGILLISTRRYKQFVQPLVYQIDENFLPEHDKIIYVFTDEYQYELESDSRIIQILIPDYKYPYATLFRYKIFSENEAELKMCSHLYYFDVDMAVIGKVGNEFLVNEGLVIVRHPGFFVNNGWGDSKNPKESASYLPIEKRKHYYCGGCQGGTAKAYLKASRIMAEGIEYDEKNGIKAEWNDETFWNWYIHTHDDVEVTEFTPSYCMPEPKSLREAWNLAELKPIILALDKNHKAIRE